MAKNPRQANAIVHLAQDCFALLEKGPRFGIAALNELLSPETIEHRGQRARIVELSCNCQAFFEQRPAHRVVAEFFGHHTRTEEGTSQSCRWRNLVDQWQEPLQTLAGLRCVVTGQPEGPQCCPEPYGGVRIKPRGCPAFDCPEIVSLALQTSEPGLLLWSDKVKRRALSHVEVVGSMARPDRVRFVASSELLPRILTNRFQHPQARLPVRLLLSPDQTLIDERRDEVQPVTHAEGAHRLGGLNAAAADEDGNPAEDSLLPGIEEVVAPADGSEQRLLARGRVASLVGQQSQRRVLASWTLLSAHESP